MARWRRRSRPGDDENHARDGAKPAYAFAALFALQFVIGTTVAAWQTVMLVLIPVFAALLVLGVLSWLGAVVVDVFGSGRSDHRRPPGA